MSNLRQIDETLLARTYALTFHRYQLNPPTREEWDQLIYASKGVLTVMTSIGTWVVPAHRALWLPGNTPFTLEVVSSTALRMLYLRRPEPSIGFDRTQCAVLNVGPLLRELILRTNQIGALEREVPLHERLAGLIHDELDAIDTVPLQLPMPTHPIAIRFTAEIGQGVTTDAAVKECGLSRRTLERIFRRETGMGLGQWVRRSRVLAALRMLGEGTPVSEIAFRLNYNGPSAFIAMFRRELGATPGAFFDA